MTVAIVEIARDRPGEIMRDVEAPTPPLQPVTAMMRPERRRRRNVT